MTADGAATGIRMLIGLGERLIRGIDPHQAADQVDAACRRQGGEPRLVWTTVYRLASERLDMLEAGPCGCAEQVRREPTRCTICGGGLPRPRLVVAR